MSDPEKFIARWSRRKRAAAEHVDEQTSNEKASNEKASNEKASIEKASNESKSPATSDAATERAHTGERDAPAAPSGTPKPPEPPEPAFDLAKLPSIESITAESDIRAFLAPGVPPDLTRAALRRAWSADPKIRDFVGMADYDWDFNTPGAIAGFGPLEMTDQLRRQVAQMVGRSLAAEAPERPAPIPTEVPVEQVSVEASDKPIESGATTAGAPILPGPSNAGTSEDEAQISGVELQNFVQRDIGTNAPQYQAEKPDDVQLIVKRPHGRALPR